MPRKVNGVAIIESNRFSQYVEPSDVAGLEDLRSWVRWFDASGIPSTLLLTDKGYAVYREGLFADINWDE
jgi:hypothetical protein